MKAGQTFVKMIQVLILIVSALLVGVAAIVLIAYAIGQQYEVDPVGVGDKISYILVLAGLAAIVLAAWFAGIRYLLFDPDERK